VTFPDDQKTKIRQGHGMSKMHRIKIWIAGAVVITFVLVMFAGVLYLNFMSNLADYNEYVACNSGTGITRIEWFLGVRPTENDCWPLHG
jgi:hypothetical protein